MLLRTLLIFCVKCEQFADLCFTFSNIRTMAQHLLCAKENALNGLRPPLSSAAIIQIARFDRSRPLPTNTCVQWNGATGMAPKNLRIICFRLFCASSLSCMFCLISHHGNVDAIEGHSHTYTHTQTHACPMYNII